jgi:hypothetical protein
MNSLRMDCIVSGLSLYTPTLLLVLAYTTPPPETGDEDHTTPVKGHKSKLSSASSGSQPSGGIRHRQNAVAPELRLIDLNSSEEVDTDDLHVSRFERLSATDYHLGVIPARKEALVAPTPKGTMEILSGMGSGMWNATINATYVPLFTAKKGSYALLSVMYKSYSSGGMLTLIYPVLYSALLQACVVMEAKDRMETLA